MLLKFKSCWLIINKLLDIFFFNVSFDFMCKDSSVNAKPTTTNVYKLIAVTKTTPQQLLMKKVILKCLSIY